MSALSYSFRKDFRRVPVVLALVVLGAASVFQGYAVNPAEKRLEALEQSIAARAPKARAQPLRLTAQDDVAGRLGQFYAFFDGELSYVDWLARFYAAAASSGIAAPRVEYRSVEPTGVPLVLHEVSIPVTGDYARIRAFAESVLNNVPVASLDRVTFRRARASDVEVEADLRFTFYLAKP
jgi:hypothetical protein